MSHLDASSVRRDFPILQRTVYDRPLVFLDSAATSQKPAVVIEAIDNFYRMSNANVRRGIHALSAEATDMFEGARATVAKFVGAADSSEIVFTRGTTESINLVAAAWGGANLGPGDAVLITEMEHHANIVPWQLVAERTGCELRAIPITDEGTLQLSELDRLLDESVKLLSVVHVSNSLGTTNPVAELVEAAHGVGALVLLDGAQSVPHRPVDVQELGVDFLAFSGHKMCGPTGAGCLWARRDILEDMPPYQGGGEMIRRVTLTGSTWAEVPAKFEAGTPPISGAIGLATAIDYLSGLGMENVHAHEQELVAYAYDALTEIPGLTIYGPATDRGGLVSFTLEGVHPHDLASILDRQGIAIRAGHHCTMPIHERLGLAATTRASFYVYNTESEVDALVEGLGQAQSLFGL
jgi:cysteine desulfurase/selenocysteine lyase